ncbi:glycosyltransferase family 2 protein [Lactobacillus psittaci]|uniref:Glycosyltransferase 2-like domain-containing protein n=1 Tax=Lactobacillus psittaci DSM 15354 TaxID=1122152 RepID=A0A0R1S127_9LACO|nr:glycosyltransferase family 2 protein [Lactobacillus psittaci]KRL62780.1 hypothetical protein FC23_GL001251 [Lactobacillus psittaci DSM 15354]
MQQPKLTVIMPVYNLAEYLPRALDALLKQEERNFKLLIVDDGSTDESNKILEQYRHSFKYFTLITTQNQGPSAARNTAIEQVDTPYFTFHDGDDFVEPGYTAFFLRAFKMHPEVDMVACGYYIDRPNKQPRAMGMPEGGLLTKGNTYLKMTNVFSSPVKGYSWNKGYKTEIVQKNNLRFDTDINLLEDQIFNVKYISVSDGFYYTQRPYYHYWQRSDSLVHKPSLKKASDNVVGNYRVWSQIVKSIMQEKELEKSQRKHRRHLLKTEGLSKESKNESYS